MSTPLTEKTKSKFPGAALARQTLLFEDARTRITQWRFAPGDQTGWHRHEWDYVTVQQSGGRLRLESKPGAGTRVTVGFPSNRVVERKAARGQR